MQYIRLWQPAELVTTADAAGERVSTVDAGVVACAVRSSHPSGSFRECGVARAQPEDAPTKEQQKPWSDLASSLLARSLLAAHGHATPPRQATQPGSSHGRAA